MIVIKVEMWPYGRAEQAREIGRAYIANVGGDVERGNYRAWVCRRNGSVDPAEVCRHEGGPAVRKGEVRDYPRLRYNMWRLVIRALRSCFPEEN